MSKQFSLEHLTKDIRERHIGNSSGRLVEKWSRTGLLRGLEGVNRENMSRLLENQAAQLLREQNALSTGAASGTSSGQVTGFTNIAFPIVRRVFGGLVANELVSLQPMSLPSGLLFYLDYTYGTNVGADVSTAGALGTSQAAIYSAGQSIYNNPSGRGVQSGSLAAGGMYDLVGTGYTKVHSTASASSWQLLASGAYQGSTTLQDGKTLHATGSDGRLVDFDAQVTDAIEADTTGAGEGKFQFLIWDVTNMPSDLDLSNFKQIGIYKEDRQTVGATGIGVFSASHQAGQNLHNLRRLNQLGTYSAGKFTVNPLVTTSTSNAALLTVVTGALLGTWSGASASTSGLSGSYVVSPTLNVESGVGSALTVPSFESNFAVGSDPQPLIPEIDIKVESIAVTATTRKLRARWSPELAQDLNAYHSLDAEVELTQILSEQIALEIDREILNDLLTQANGANLFWSRAPGKFVNKESGNQVTRATSLHPGPQFTGTVREWYETLVETIIDCANTIHRKTLRGSANFIVVSPDVATILESSVLYKPNYSLDGNGQVSNPMTMGAEAIGTVSNRFTVYKDPYFPRNKVLVGFKGGSYLETGYVYAPYVPLIVTPTIFAPEDFTPRKGVMTRYGKKMVRSDFYGTVTVMDLSVI